MSWWYGSFGKSHICNHQDSVFWKQTCDGWVWHSVQGQLLSMTVVYLQGKDALVVVSIRKVNVVDAWIFLNNLLSKTMRLVFDGVEPRKTLSLSRGNFLDLLAWSSAFRSSRKLFSEKAHYFSVLEISFSKNHVCWLLKSQNWNNLIARKFLMDNLINQTTHWWNWEL